MTHAALEDTYASELATTFYDASPRTLPYLCLPPVALHRPRGVLRQDLLDTLHLSCVPGAWFDLAIDTGAIADVCFDARRAHGVHGIMTLVNSLDDGVPWAL